MASVWSRQRWKDGEKYQSVNFAINPSSRFFSLLHCRYPPLEPKLIYGHLVVFIICGVCMSFNFARKQSTLVHVGQLLYLGFQICVSERLKYTQWVTVSWMNFLEYTSKLCYDFYVQFSCGYLEWWISKLHSNTTNLVVELDYDN